MGAGCTTAEWSLAFSRTPPREHAGDRAGEHLGPRHAVVGVVLARGGPTWPVVAGAQLSGASEQSSSHDTKASR